jgi:hypothetical protein
MSQNWPNLATSVAVNAKEGAGFDRFWFVTHPWPCPAGLDKLDLRLSSSQNRPNLACSLVQIIFVVPWYLGWFSSKVANKY